MLRIHSVLILLCLACGKEEFPDYEEVVIQPANQEEEVVMRTNLIPLNSHLTGPINGTGLFWIKKIQFYARINIDTQIPSSRFQQYIHAGSTCPDRSADINNDGTIDFSELKNISQGMIIPLDGKLGSQAEGRNWFPVTDDDGHYYYSRSSFYQRIMEDLWSDDSDSRDSVVKLPRGEELALNRRVVVIYGVVDDLFLPLACGVIRMEN